MIAVHEVRVYAIPLLLLIAALGVGFLAGWLLRGAHQVIESGRWRAEYRRHALRGGEEWHLEYERPEVPGG